MDIYSIILFVGGLNALGAIALVAFEIIRDGRQSLGLKSSEKHG